MKINEQSSLFTEITSQEEADINGGLTLQQQLGAALGIQGYGWWQRNFYGTNSFSAKIAVTDRYLNGLLGSLRQYGFRY